MTDFGLELGASRIVDVRSREAFREVLASFTSGHYRSALVVLWTVLVCDIVYKLQDLSDLYEDKTAASILKEIASLQERNPTSPSWERELLDRVFKRTHLLNQAEYESLSQIQGQRHLAAHPILTEAQILYQPTPEMTRACLRTALEAVLLKPPIFTKEVINELLVDLEEKKDVLPDDQSLQRYLEAKYFPRLVQDLENRLFRSLWKLTFWSDDDRAEQNREINYRTLCLLYRRDRQARYDYISADRQFFSELRTGPGLDWAIDFLARFPPVYGLLTEAPRTLIQNLTESQFGLFSRAWFLSDSVKEHLDRVRLKIEDTNRTLDFQEWTSFLDAATREDERELALDVGISIYVTSDSYDAANANFQACVLPYLSELSTAHFEHLFRGIEGNDQTYDRYRASRDHRRLIDRYEETTGSTPDAEMYPRLMQPFGET